MNDSQALLRAGHISLEMAPAIETLARRLSAHGLLDVGKTVELRLTIGQDHNPSSPSFYLLLMEVLDKEKA